MPKLKESAAARLSRYVKEFGKDTWKTDGRVLFCKVCDCDVTAGQRSQITQHVNGKEHSERLREKVNKPGSSGTQLMLTENIESETLRAKRVKFQEDLCDALVHADIPFWKLQNLQFVKFLEKYTSNRIPDESTIRKTYLAGAYQRTLEAIRGEMQNSNIYVQLDETTDKTGRMIANVVIGRMSDDSPGSPRLLHLAALERTNQHTISQLFEESMSLLWPGGVQRDRVLLLVTDAAPYMKAAARGLCDTLYPNCVHVTCLAHALHRVCEEVRGRFPETDALVSNGKKIFLKSPNRIRLFRELAPELSLPPEPVITRWGTWMSAVRYYAENSATVQRIVDELDADAQSIVRVRSLLSSVTVRDEVAFITANYSFLAEAIEKLEKSGSQLRTALEVVNDASRRIESVEGDIGRHVRQKLKAVLDGNKGYVTLGAISRILASEATEEDHNLECLRKFSAAQLACFKYAPVVSCDVERSFSRYRAMLRDNRQSFTTEHIKMYFVVQCYMSE
jgi:hypothetical protein